MAARSFRFFAGLLMLWLCAMASGAQAKGDYQIGVYYFPGWKSHQLGNARELPWEVIKPYPEREPLLGWYEEDQPGVMAQQLRWMAEYGIDYVVFDWYGKRDASPALAHALNAYLTAPDRHGIQFAILWSNHTEYNYSREQLRAHFTFWAQRYLHRQDYLKLGNLPVVFIFSSSVLKRNAEKIGMTTSELFEMANEIARGFGLPGVAFVGGGSTDNRAEVDFGAASGYSGFTAYYYYNIFSRRFAGDRRIAHGFSELDEVYGDQWAWALANTSGTFVVPISSGWDRRPWGGSKDPKMDGNRPTPAQFRRHLEAARALMDKHPEKTRRMGVICCWNEYGEGAFIEPTKRGGFDYLRQVRDVFVGKQ